jgi:2,3-bisphosphoglycerate-independent phosphoglycerate mutase
MNNTPEISSELEEKTKPIILVIMDGFGIAPDEEGNAITKARTPVFDRLTKQYPTTTLRASGEEVGLTWGRMGNSEVGHLTIGAGQIVHQTLPQIDKEIESGAFFENPVLCRAVKHAKKNKSALHLVGLLSKGCVHACDDHLDVLLEFAKAQKLKKVFVHAILDGRDTLFNAGIDYLRHVEKKTKELGVGKIASVSGRFYAMDRDRRWDRTQKAYEAMVEGMHCPTEDVVECVKDFYQKDIFDEHIEPFTLIEKGKPVGLIDDNDAIVFFNFRADRMRQLVKSFALPHFDKFPTQELENLSVVSMVSYDKTLPVQVAYPHADIYGGLAETISAQGLSQLHIAETEKYAHITYFFNGKKEDAFKGEDRVLIPSLHVASYKDAPAMSAKAIADAAVQDLQEDPHAFMLINLANPDMVAHTGDMKATIKAVEATDQALGKIVDEALSAGATVVITGDHGNAEEVKNLRTKEIDTEHSTNPVPLILVGKQFDGKQFEGGDAPEGDLSLLSPSGGLIDIAPTILSLLHIEIPKEMQGKSLW